MFGERLYALITRWDTLFIIDFLFAIGHLWIEKRRFSWKFAAKINSITCTYYSCLSLCLLIYSCYIFGTTSDLFGGSISTICSELPKTREISWIFFLYYLSKFHEYSDIILVLLMAHPPLEHRLHPHFRYHHLTTPFFALIFLECQCGHHAFFMLSNLLMHFLVYLYHSRPAFGKNAILFWACRIWGHVQLLVGMAFSGYSFLNRVYIKRSPVPCGCIWSDVVPFALYLFYFILFQYQIYWPWPPVSAPLEKKNHTLRDKVKTKIK